MFLSILLQIVQFVGLMVATGLALLLTLIVAFILGWVIKGMILALFD